ncbi:hypothetical protein EGW08_019585, partial [Elysia chlorotica]
QCLRYGFFQVGTDLVRPPPPASRTPVNLPSQTSPLQKPSGKPPNTFPTSYPMDQKNEMGGGYHRGGEDKYGALPTIPGPGKQNNDGDLFSMTVSKKQSGTGRKRWGAGLSDTWDDWTDFDFLPNKTTKKVPQQQQQSNQPMRNNGLFGKENNDDDFLGSLMPKKSQGGKPTHRINSGRSSAASAKQHYLSKSRYQAGMNPKASARRDSMRRDSLGLGTDWANPLGKVSPLGAITSTQNRGPKNDLDYVPSFLGGKGGNGGGFGSPSNFSNTNKPYGGTTGFGGGGAGGGFGSPLGAGGGGGGGAGGIGGYQPSIGGGYRAGGVGGAHQSSFNPSGAPGGGYQPSMGSGPWKKTAPLPAVGTGKKGQTGGNFGGTGPRRTDWASKYLKS